ncbi:hypothetical protein BC332_23230 [Capsicum chinense]|nr:hypothetical protein BC332_23230 [Capsicum chinense]
MGPERTISLVGWAEIGVSRVFMVLDVCRSQGPGSSRDKEEGPMQDDSYTEEQYMAGPIEGMSFRCVQTAFAFYKEHNRLTGFGVVKKSAKKLAGQLNYVTFGCDKCRKTMTKKQRKRVDFKAKGIEKDYEKESSSARHCSSKAFKEHKTLRVGSWRPRKNEVHSHGLSGLTNYKPAKARSKAITFDSITTAEFEDKWQAFIEEYDLGRQIWFQSLYSERSKWVPLFIKHFFWAGIMSTQRCESMHVFFDGYISVRSSLKQFVEQYEVTLRFKYEKEFESQASERKFVHVEGPRSTEIDLRVNTHLAKDARRWGFGYYDVYDEGQSSPGRSGSGRRGRRGSRGGGVCGSRGGRGNDTNPTEESFDGVQRDTEQLFKAMVELDEQIRSSQDRLEFMMIWVNAMEERIKVIRKETFDRYRKDQDNFLRPST